jgi:hypothetical protein
MTEQPDDNALTMSAAEFRKHMEEFIRTTRPEENALTMSASEFKKHLAEFIRTTTPAPAPVIDPNQKDCLQMTPAEFKQHCKETGFYSPY